eukprot:6257235-Heterocapsa_arctica.AAC.1
MVRGVGRASVRVGLNRLMVDFRGRFIDVQGSSHVHHLRQSAQPQVLTLRRDLPSLHIQAVELILGFGPDPFVVLATPVVRPADVPPVELIFPG